MVFNFLFLSVIYFFSKVEGAGLPIAIESAPSQVLVIVPLNNNYVRKCGGVLIKKEMVLTAAHCFNGYPKKQPIKIVAGTPSRMGTNGVVRDTVHYVIHSSYRKLTTSLLDLALIQVDPPFPITKKIRPVTMSSKQPKTGDIAYITGWGAQREKTRPLLLQGRRVKILGSGCSELAETPLPHDIMCTWDSESVCEGDSGGPVFVKGRLVGINVKLCGCEKPGMPNFHTNIKTVRQWIDDTTGYPNHDWFMEGMAPYLEDRKKV